jgi:PIN domain nuclease of toxin-antitoxin system
VDIATGASRDAGRQNEGREQHTAATSPGPASDVRLLLDTCTFLWLAGGGASLSKFAATAIRDPGNQVFLSAVSTWEIASKYKSGRLPLPEPPDRLIPTERGLRGVLALSFDEASALQALRLPPLHRDPFDRMLVSQAIAGSLVIVTPDPLITQYPVRVLW